MVPRSPFGPQGPFGGQPPGQPHNPGGPQGTPDLSQDCQAVYTADNMLGSTISQIDQLCGTICNTHDVGQRRMLCQQLQQMLAQLNNAFAASIRAINQLLAHCR